MVAAEIHHQLAEMYGNVSYYKTLTCIYTTIKSPSVLIRAFCSSMKTCDHADNATQQFCTSSGEKYQNIPVDLAPSDCHLFRVLKQHL
jgi:hypothetical protein